MLLGIFRRLPWHVAAAVWFLTVLLAFASPGRASAAEVPISEETEQQADDSDDPEVQKRMLTQYNGFRAARALGISGIGIMGVGAAVAAIGVAGVAVGLVVMLATFSVEPGLSIIGYSLLGTLGGAGLVGVGSLVLVSGVLSMTFTLHRMGVDVSYAGFGIAGVSAAVTLGIVAYAAGSQTEIRVAPFLVSAGLVPVGLLVQLISTNTAFERYRRENPQVRVTPRLGPNEWGAAVVTTF